ncbi:hypothetical protein L500_1322 [Bordetella holmesii CDC-H643-BH]|nr:hypothetical protein L500_1322 [Bordetella holmesii CDC-H643-BH]
MGGWIMAGQPVNPSVENKRFLAPFASYVAGSGASGELRRFLASFGRNGRDVEPLGFRISCLAPSKD